MKHVLPDLLEPNLKVAFCGTAAGGKSAKVGAYYAGPGNQFWDIIYRIGLTPRRFQPNEYQLLAEHEIGLTDLAKFTHGSDERLSISDFDSLAMEKKIIELAPKALAFNGKKAAKIFFGQKNVKYGLQRHGIGKTSLFVLPSTSGAARGYWDETYWYQLAEFVNKTDE